MGAGSERADVRILVGKLTSVCVKCCIWDLHVFKIPNRNVSSALSFFHTVRLSGGGATLKSETA